MRTSRMVPGDAQKHFWHVVRACLLRFHGMRSQAANARIQRLRRSVEELPPRPMAMFFHTEAFYVACELAGEALDLCKFQKEYVAIRDAKDGSSRGVQRTEKRENSIVPKKNSEHGEIQWIIAQYGFGPDVTHIGVPEYARAIVQQMADALVGRSGLVAIYIPEGTEDVYQPGGARAAELSVQSGF